MPKGIYSAYLTTLKKVCARKGLRLITIGTTRTYPIVMVTNIARQTKKPALCFSAGIHGDEIAGPLAVLEFITKQNFGALKNLPLYFLPVANPSGFDRGTRRNLSRRDLNRHFCDDELNQENKILYDAIKNKNVYFFHALHEDLDEKGFYLYNYEHKPEPIYRHVLILAKRYCPLQTKAAMSNDKNINGLVTNKKDGSFEDRLFRAGVPLTMCTESPGKLPLKKRQNLNYELMKFVLNFFMTTPSD